MVDDGSHSMDAFSLHERIMFFSHFDSLSLISFFSRILALRAKLVFVELLYVKVFGSGVG